MNNEDFLTIPEFAKIIGLSRIAVYKQVKSGKIKAKRAGRVYLIPGRYIQAIVGKPLTDKSKQMIKAAVKKTVADYGEVLKMLGKE